MNQYDCFYAAATKGRIAIKELQALEQQKTPQHIYYCIAQLEQRKLVRRTNGFVEVLHTSQAKELFSLLQFCVANSLDYVFYFSKPVLQYLAKVYGRRSYSSAMMAAHITHRLEKDTFLVTYRRKPFLGRVLQHSFLTRLLAHHHVKPTTHGTAVGTRCMDELLKKHKVALRRGFRLNRIGFVHHSLLLEGNLLTLRETELLLKEKITPQKPLKDAQEVISYNAAIDGVEELLTSRAKMHIGALLALHAQAMRHTDFAGTIRKENVVIKGNPQFRTAKHPQISALLQSLCDEINSFTSKDPVVIIEKAAAVHNQFQYIHPFIDGNSRTTRLLLYWFLRHNLIGFADIPLGFTTEYLAATKGSRTRDDDTLRRLLKELCLQQINAHFS